MATKTEKAIAADEAKHRSILTGEVLKEKGLCPFVIIRTRDAGVQMGYLAHFYQGTGEAEMLEVRRLWSWSGGRNTLNEIATEGVTSGRISKPVRYNVICDVAEIIEVTDEAVIQSLRTSRWD